jgi:hypothetical protein
MWDFPLSTHVIDLAAQIFQSGCGDVIRFWFTLKFGWEMAVLLWVLGLESQRKLELDLDWVGIGGREHRFVIPRLGVTIERVLRTEKSLARRFGRDVSVPRPVLGAATCNRSLSEKSEKRSLIDLTFICLETFVETRLREEFATEDPLCPDRTLAASDDIVKEGSMLRRLDNHENDGIASRLSIVI